MSILQPHTIISKMSTIYSKNSVTQSLYNIVLTVILCNMNMPNTMNSLSMNMCLTLQLVCSHILTSLQFILLSLHLISSRLILSLLFSSCFHLWSFLLIGNGYLMTISCAHFTFYLLMTFHHYPFYQTESQRAKLSVQFKNASYKT